MRILQQQQQGTAFCFVCGCVSECFWFCGGELCCCLPVCLLVCFAPSFCFVFGVFFLSFFRFVCLFVGEGLLLCVLVVVACIPIFLPIDLQLRLLGLFPSFVKGDRDRWREGKVGVVAVVVVVVGNFFGF